MKFPENPSNGMIFEATPGVYYQYSSVTKSWYRVNTPSIPLATEFNDGLMSSEDFVKLTGLLIPPPKINLSFEDCDTVFNKGLLLLQGDEDGIIILEVKDENLHENTGVIDFKIDTQKLVQKLLDLGQLRLTAPQGEQGPKGEPGEDGANALPVGPQGEDGKDGANAPWPGTLSEETFDVAQQNRAIVDITTENVGPDENYIVVRRANIGNPEACPDTIIPQDVQSPWILGFSTGPGNVVFTKIVSPVTGEVCGWTCNSDLYYFDIDNIIQGIETQFLEWMALVKAEKENLAETWLDAMMSEFNEQKSALCCALEACRSRGRNERTRQYIEQQRIQAAQADFQLVVGADEDKHFPPLDNEGECTWNIAPPNYNLLHLSDPNCEVDWTGLCPDQTGGPATAVLKIQDDSIIALNESDSLQVVSDEDTSEVQDDDIIALNEPARTASVDEDISAARVESDIPSNLEAQTVSSGKYINGTKIETDSLIQWTWNHKDNPLWTLVIWYCKIDQKYASRLFENVIGGHDWGFGLDSNVTACFQAGEIIDIKGIKKDQFFTLSGSGDISDGTAKIRIT